MPENDIPEQEKMFSLEEMQQQMELQLHQQYAENNNASLSSIIALFAGLLTAIGAYGYVYLHSANYFEPVLLPTESVCYSLTQLSYALIAAIFVIDIMICLCIIQGTAQRNEQFIIYGIRRKAYGDSIPSFFPRNYVPYGKRGLRIVQGLYGEIVKISCLTQIVILFSYVCKIGINIWEYHDKPLNIEAIIVTSLTCTLCFIFGWIVCLCMHNSEKKYSEREKNMRSASMQSNKSQSIEPPIEINDEPIKRGIIKNLRLYLRKIITFRYLNLGK